jgi:hypothetical protein
MVKTFAAPKLLVLAVLAVALLALPAAAAAAPEEGPGSPLTVSPDPIVAPKTTVGNNGAALQVEITNPGEEAFVDKVSLEGEETGEFFVNGSDCSTLAEGQKCSFWFGLKPSTVGLKQATLTITFQGGRSPETFAVSGESVAPQLSFTPSSYDFGIRQINRDTSSTQLQVTNSGEAPVQPNNFEIQGDTSVFWTGNSNCWMLLEPGQSCSVEVNFNPHERTSYAAEVRTSANGSSFSAGLSGIGGAAVIETLENPVGFGSATVGSEGAIRTIELTNSGDLPAGFFISVIAGGDSGSFRLLDENCTGAELAPGGSCTAHVRFTPQAAGPKTARLAFFGDGSDGMMVFLSGEGVGAAATLFPSAFDFGSLAVGTRSVPHAFAVRNDGGAPLLLARVAVVGPDLDQFELAGEECTGTSLDPGEECLAWVRFAPDRSGVKSATLRVAGSGTVLTAGLTARADPRKHKGKHRRFARNKTIRAGARH